MLHLPPWGGSVAQRCLQRVVRRFSEGATWHAGTWHSQKAEHVLCQQAHTHLLGWLVVAKAREAAGLQSTQVWHKGAVSLARAKAEGKRGIAALVLQAWTAAHR